MLRLFVEQWHSEDKMNERRYRPFSNGTQCWDWDARNCERCRLPDFDQGVANCELFDALNEAYLGDGTLSWEAAFGIGYIDDQSVKTMEYVWPCRKRVTTPGLCKSCEIRAARAGLTI